MKFSENLRQLRKEKDISQEALALDLKVSRQTISKWENGSAMPDMKKLTELAEYFNTTMDRLLGLSNDTSDDKRENNGSHDYTQYINSMLAFFEENEKKRYNKLFKRFVAILIVLVIAFSITVCSITNNFNNQIFDLSSRINNIQSNTNYYQGSDDYDDDESKATDYEIIGIDSEKPYIFKVKFKYEPESYPKNADIYFLIPQRAGEAKKVEAENSNGIFTLTTDVDIMAKGKYYVCIDDGNEITKENIVFNLLLDAFSTSANSISCTENYYDSGNNVTSINICCDDEGVTFTEDVDFRVIKGLTVEKASIVALANGKEVLNKELKIKTPSDSYYTGAVELVPLKINADNEPINNLCLYISFITDKGLELRCYPNIVLGYVEVTKSGCYEIVCDEDTIAYDDGYELYSY